MTTERLKRPRDPMGEPNSAMAAGGELVLAILLLTACTMGQTVYLKNANGDTAECGVPYISYDNPAAIRKKIRDCVSDYQREGYDFSS